MRWALVALLLAAIGATSIILLSCPTIGGDYVPVDFIEVEVIDSEMSTLILYSGSRSLQMVISSSQGISIQMGIQNIRSLRPNTHDLQADIMKETGTDVLMVGIDSLENGYFTATMHVRSGIFASTIDCRPSDCTAIAIRMGAPIYINSELFSLKSDQLPAVPA